jgi:hypothetical protein
MSTAHLSPEETKMTTLEAIRAAIAPIWHDYDYIGLRVQCPVEAAGTKVGSKLRRSFERPDDVKGRRLSGTAAFYLSSNLDLELPRVWEEMQRLGYTPESQFSRLVVIGSNDGADCEDMPERYAIAIKNAKLLAVIA